MGVGQLGRVAVVVGVGARKGLGARNPQGPGFESGPFGLEARSHTVAPFGLGQSRPGAISDPPTIHLLVVIRLSSKGLRRVLKKTNASKSIRIRF